MGVDLSASVPQLSDDYVQTFQIEGMNVRGRIVRLGAVVDRVLQAHNYPEPVARLTGETLAMVSMLGASLKFDGILTVQTRGAGPLRMLVADFTSPGIVRACASFDAVRIADTAPNFSELVGPGSFAMTIDQGSDMERYQGIVPLEADGLVASALAYFQLSEQIPTAMKVAAAPVMIREADGRLRQHWRAGGIMIQNMAVLGGHSAVEVDDPEDAWTRASVFLNSTEAHELLDPLLPSTRLLYRLFHEDGVRVFPSTAVNFGCRCSRERVGTVLATYTRDELADLVIDGAISATCEFCSETYRFGLDEVAAT